MTTASESIGVSDVCLPDGDKAKEPLLLRAPQAAVLLSTSVRTWRTLNATGKIPRAIRLGRSTYWRPEELKAWVAAGCPDRVSWEMLQQL